MTYRDYRFEPTINTDGDGPEGCGFGILVIVMFGLIYWLAS